MNTEAGLSLFDRKRVRTEESHKPFSSILDDYSTRAEKQSTLDEITLIKEKFTKNKIYTPMDNLMKGLTYLENETSNAEKITLPPTQLPSNPFMKVAKKKKKKKK